MSSVLRDLRSVFSYLVVSWAASLGVRMLLPRVLGPFELGRYTTADSLAQAIAVLAAWGFPAWIGREFARSDRRSAEEGAAVLGVSLTLALLSVGLMLAVAAAFGYEAETLLLCGVGVSASLAQVNLVVTRLLEVERRYDLVRRVTVRVRIGWAVVSLAIFGLTLANLLTPRAALQLFVGATALSEAARFVVATAYSGVLNAARGKAARSPGKLSLQVIYAAAPFFFSGAFALVAWRLPALVLLRGPAAELGQAAVAVQMGLYGAGVTLNGAVLMFVPALQAVIMPRLSALRAKPSRVAFDALMAASLEATILGAGFIASLIALLARPIVSILFGNRFDDAWTVVLVSADTLFFTYVLVVMSFGFSCDGRERFLAVASLVGIPVTLGSALLLVQAGFFANGATDAAAASAANEMAMLLLFALVARRSPWLERRTAAFFVATTLAVGGASVLAFWEKSASWRTLGATAALFALIYAGAAYAGSGRRLVAAFRQMGAE